MTLKEAREKERKERVRKRDRDIVVESREKVFESWKGYRLCLLARLQDINISVNVVRRREIETLKLGMYSHSFFEAKEILSKFQFDNHHFLDK